MTIPAIILGFVISTLIGSAFNLWKGGGFGRLILYIALSWAGFWGGHWIGNLIHWTFGSIGPINMGMAFICCVACLGIGYWLSLVKIASPS